MAWCYQIVKHFIHWRLRRDSNPAIACVKGRWPSQLAYGDVVLPSSMFTHPGLCVFVRIISTVRIICVAIVVSLFRLPVYVRLLWLVIFRPVSSTSFSKLHIALAVLTGWQIAGVSLSIFSRVQSASRVHSAGSV